MEDDHAAKYRKVMKTVLLSNKISGLDCQRLAMASTLAGSRGVEDFGKAGTGGSHPQNIHRDLLRSIMKDSDYPTYYFADVPLYDPKLQSTVIVRMPFLLPHEMVQVLHMNGKLTSATTKKETCPKGVWSHLRKAANLLEMPISEIIACGIHGDGTPCGAKESLEQISWSLPCWQGEGFSPRFLIFSVLKEFVAKQSTWNAVFEIIAWSFKCLFAKQWPEQRHDASPWGTKDVGRSKLTGAMAVSAVLCQARGDWAFFKEVFNFPAWNCKDSMCWMCSASRDTMTDFSQTAPWRINRRGPNDLLISLRSQGIKPCPLFSIPLFHPGCVLVDWLHTMDLGVAADMLGNFFHEMLSYMAGNNKKERVKSLWILMQRWYDSHPEASTLNHLTVEMIKKDQSKPKLRGKASQVKSLVPFAADLARQHCQGSARLDTMRSAMNLLAFLYRSLDEPQWPLEEAAAAGRKMLLLYSALRAEQTALGNCVFWQLKPKHHLLLELLEFVAADQGNPKLYWTYADEDFGGWLAALARRRGGHRTPVSVALNLLNNCTCIEHVGNLNM